MAAKRAEAVESVRQLEQREEAGSRPQAVADPSTSETDGRRLPVLLLQAGVILGACAWFAYALPDYGDQLLDASILLFIGVVILVDLIPVPAWGGMQLSLSFPILLAVAIIFPTPIAGLIALLGSIDPRELRREVTLFKAVTNRAQMALSIIAGGAAFHAVATLDSRWFRLMPSVMLAAVVAYASNTMFVAVHGALSHRVPLHRVLVKMHGTRPYEFLLSYLGLGLFGAVIAQVYAIEGIWPVIVFLAPLIFARQMYFRSRTLADQLAEQNSLLAEQAERLEELLRKEHETVDELRELNQMKGEFVAVVSHELRTPVTALIGYAKTLQQREFAEDTDLRDEFLGRMERQGDRLLRLVENLLTASRLESRELPVSIGRVLFEDICREIVEGLSAEASRVRLDVPDNLPVLSTDRQLLGRIVSNLIDNALKYSPETAVCELGARSERDTLTFWVRDHGIGIPQEQVGRIFDRFYQVDSSSTRTFAGAGLGLSLVSDLLKHLGGTIDVTSTPDEGSTFTVRLPVRFRGNGAAQEPAAAEARSPR